MAWLKNYQPKDLFAVVMDAKTGEIFSIHKRPTFNPKTGKSFVKPAVSLSKHIRASININGLGLAAAIQEGAFDPDKKYKSGRGDIMGSRIFNWNK